MLGPKVTVTGSRSIPYNSLFTGSQGIRIKAITLEDLETECVKTHGDLDFFFESWALIGVYERRPQEKTLQISVGTFD